MVGLDKFDHDSKSKNQGEEGPQNLSLPRCGSALKEQQEEGINQGIGYGLIDLARRARNSVGFEHVVAILLPYQLVLRQVEVSVVGILAVDQGLKVEFHHGLNPVKACRLGGLKAHFVLRQAQAVGLERFARGNVVHLRNVACKVAFYVVGNVPHKNGFYGGILRLAVDLAVGEVAQANECRR